MIYDFFRMAIPLIGKEKKCGLGMKMASNYIFKSGTGFFDKAALENAVLRRSRLHRAILLMLCHYWFDGSADFSSSSTATGSR